MKIYRIAINALDMEDLYKDAKDALDYLDEDYISKSKTSLKKVIKKIEELRPMLKHHTKWLSI